MPLWTSNRPGIRLRIQQSTPKIRFRVVSRLSSTIVGTNGDVATNSGGTWNIGPAYPSLVETLSIADRSALYFRTYNSTTLSYSRTNLATILTSISAGLDATLVSIAALTPTTDQGIYFSGTDTAAAYSLTAQGRAIGGLASTAGFVAVTGAGNAAVRTITGTSAEIDVANGTGASGAPTLSLPTSLTFTGKTVTGGTFSAPTITGGTHTAITSFGIRSTGAAFDLTLATSEVLTAARILSVVMGDAARTLTFTANATIGGTHSGTSSGTNTGDQTITLTGDVAGSGTGSFATTLATAQPAAHTWALAQTFTVAPVFTDASGSRTALGLGTAAVKNTGTSGNTVPLLDGANTWSAAQTLNAALTYGGVTLANAVTGTGNMVLSASPTFTGTITAAAANFSGTLTFGTGTITGLTNKASPDSTNDYVVIYDNAGTAVKKATVGAIGAAGSVASIGGATGAITLADSLAITGTALGTTQTQHGACEFVNNGTANVMLLVPYDGNGCLAYDSINSAWKMLKIPDAVTITGAANNGSGLIRITHSVSSRPFVSNQWVYIYGVGGTTEANETWAITVIDSTHFDLQSSAFTNAYTSGGTIHGSVPARRDNITINGVANQTLANDTLYCIGLKYLDAACTVGTLVARTTAYVMNTSVGFNVLNNDTTATLVGAVVPRSNSIQGGANTELLVSWYNRGRVELAANITGATGANTTPVAMTGYVEFIQWPDGGAILSLDAEMVRNAVGSGKVSFMVTPLGGAKTSMKDRLLYVPVGTAPVQATIMSNNLAPPFNLYRYEVTITSSDTTVCSLGTYNATTLSANALF
jgi:hypothetical protein